MQIRGITMPFGDSFIITWSGMKGDHCILLDSGTSKSYRSCLRQYLKSLHHNIDLWVISHPHDDHIGGVMKYIDDIQGGIKVPSCDRWMYNSIKRCDAIFYESPDGTTAASPRQDDKLYSFLKTQNSLVDVFDAINGMSMVIDGLELHVVTPLVIPHYIKKVENDASIAVSVSHNDYGIKVDDFCLESFIEDVDEYNAVSISLIISHQGKTFFWMADCHPSVLCNGLKLLNYSKDNPLICDYATLPHHGSKGNINDELLSMIRCNTFIITANGVNKYNLPNKEALVKVLKSPLRNIDNHIIFIFPEENSTLKSLFEVDGEPIFQQYNFEMAFQKSTEIVIYNL